MKIEVNDRQALRQLAFKLNLYSIPYSINPDNTMFVSSDRIIIDKIRSIIDMLDLENRVKIKQNDEDMKEEEYNQEYTQTDTEKYLELKEMKNKNETQKIFNEALDSGKVNDAMKALDKLIKEDVEIVSNGTPGTAMKMFKVNGEGPYSYSDLRDDPKLKSQYDILNAPAVRAIISKNIKDLEKDDPKYQDVRISNGKVIITADDGKVIAEVPLSAVKKESKITLKEWDTEEFGTPDAEELHMFTDNEASLYRTMRRPIELMLKRKKDKGIYDHALAYKAYMPLVEAGAKLYVKQFGEEIDNWFDVFPMSMRKECAELFVYDFEAEYAANGMESKNETRKPMKDSVEAEEYRKDFLKSIAEEAGYSTDKIGILEFLKSKGLLKKLTDMRDYIKKSYVELYDIYHRPLAETLKEGFEQDFDAWFDKIADISELYFEGEIEDPLLDELVMKLEDIESNPEHAGGQDYFENLYSTIEELGKTYEGFKNFFKMLVVGDVYKNEFKDRTWYEKTMIDLLRQSMLYYEDETEIE